MELETVPVEKETPLHSSISFLVFDDIMNDMYLYRQG